ncbi:MAG: septum formation initiator family protein [Deltaproteobacteria bacterium]|nr:septum formation initiator family protein [Deltaproteobacteria bacterium]
MFIVCSALAVGFFGYAVWGSSGGKRGQLEEELAEMRSWNDALRIENQRLRLEVDALKRRSDYLEQVARDELGLVRADEILFQLDADAKASSSEP